jgi:hypothetical protein
MYVQGKGEERRSVRGSARETEETASEAPRLAFWLGRPTRGFVMLSSIQAGMWRDSFATRKLHWAGYADVVSGRTRRW